MVVMTPTEDLVLEVLAARYRLGETYWTFDSRHGPTLTKLQARGLVTTMHGVVEKTVRASLTEKGKEEQLDKNYTPPIFKELKKKQRKKLRSW